MCRLRKRREQKTEDRPVFRADRELRCGGEFEFTLETICIHFFYHCKKKQQLNNHPIAGRARSQFEIFNRIFYDNHYIDSRFVNFKSVEIHVYGLNILLTNTSVAPNLFL